MENSIDLKIGNFETGVAQSQYKGHALMRNIDIGSMPGAMRAKDNMLMMIVLCTTTTFTVVGAPTSLPTAAVSLKTQAEIDVQINYNGCAVQFTTTGTLPGGLSLNTVYFLIYVNDTVFSIASSLANAIAGISIQLTTNGTGTHTITAVAPGTIKYIKKDQRGGTIFALDSSGNVWHTRGSNIFYLLPGNSKTGATGNGLEIFYVSDASATYLFVFRGAKIDVINVYGITELNALAWTTDWQPLNSLAGSGNRHAALLGQDNIIYFTDGKYVGSIQEKPGSVFAPGTAGTYTYNNQALTLPGNEYAYCLSELNVNLLVGGNTFNKIYPWDRVSVSFGNPILVPEKGIYEILNVGNKIAILAGQKGIIYQTQGTYVTKLKEIPGYLINNGNSLASNAITWGGLAFVNGAIIFGVAMTLNSSASGLYKLYDDGTLVQDNTPYAGASNVTAIYAESDLSIYIGYNGGIDNSSGVKTVAGTYNAVYQSEVYQVGNKTQKMAYSQIEIQCGRNQGGNIRASYRTDVSASFTTLATFTTADTSFNSDIGLQNLENLQLQLEFDRNIEIISCGLFN